MLETVILKKNITFLLFWYMKWCFELLMIGMQNRNTMYRFYNDYTKICVYKTMYKSMNMYMYCWWDANIPHKTDEILAFLTKVKRYQHSKSNIWNRVGFYDKCFTLIRNKFKNLFNDQKLYKLKFWIWFIFVHILNKVHKLSKHNN